MPSCAVKVCKNHSLNKKVKNSGITFHRFPTDPRRKELWIEAVNRGNEWFPNRSTTICSKHFEKRFIYFLNNKCYLTSEASPTISLQDDEMSDKALSPDQGKIKMAVEPFTASECNTPRKKKMLSRIAYLETVLKQRQKNIKRLQHRQRTLKRKMGKMEDLYKELKSKSLLQDNDIDILRTISISNAEIMQRQLLTHKNLPMKRKYSEQLRTFALTLHYFSPRAYDYVRKSFQSCLPHTSTLSKWYQNINGSPGLTKESFNAIKNVVSNTKYPILCSLVLDEMSIRKKIEWDGNKFHGHVTFGGDEDGDCIEEAKDALVFLAVAINCYWRIPIGYFLVNGIKGEQKANLVHQCISALENVGVRVTSITFDGCPANINMANILGCNLSANNMKITFQSKTTNRDIAVIIDPCHALKLVRNCFQAKCILYDADNLSIKWSYLVELNKLQTDETFVLANKLRSKHLNFQNNIMKVKLASQLFSRSVAVALDFCANRLNLTEFNGVDGTYKFLKIINDLFDVLNSKNMLQKNFKKPLCKENFHSILQFLELAEKYIKGLYVKETKFSKMLKCEVETNVQLINSSRKTGFIGFLTGIQSLKFLYETLIIKENLLNYIPFYKFNQDHIEMVFSVIRAKGGYNNNPTALQFRSAYRKILVKSQLHFYGNENCIPLETIPILSCSSAIESINKSNERARLNDSTLSNDDLNYNLLSELQTITQFSRSVTTYIAGFVAKKIKKYISCEWCVSACITTSGGYELGQEDLGFIKIRDFGGLLYPSADVVTVCLKTEQLLKTYIEDGCIKYNFKKAVFINSILRWFIGTNIFKCLTEHQFDQAPLENHRNTLVKAVIDIYLNIRVFFLTKNRQSESSKRQVFNKMVLFQGQ